MKMKSAVVLACGLAISGASVVAAQTPNEPARVFVSVSGGFQPVTRTITEAGGFVLYDEPGSFTGSNKIDSGPFFDIGGGMQVFGKFSVGAAVSRFTKSSSVPYTVIVPHPMFYDTMRTGTLNANNMKHTETALHLQVFYQLLSTGKYDASVVAGPSIFFVKQDSVNGQSIAATETGSPYTAMTLSGTFNSQSKTAVGGHVGVDFTYHVTGGIGAGVFIRYTGATAKLASGNVTVGGPQVGVGLRYRF